MQTIEENGQGGLIAVEQVLTASEAKKLSEKSISQLPDEWVNSALASIRSATELGKLSTVLFCEAPDKWPFKEEIYTNKLKELGYSVQVGAWDSGSDASPYAIVISWAD